MDILIIAALVLGSLCVGLVVGLGVMWFADIRRKIVAMSEAELILDQAREEQRKIVLEAKEEALQNRREGESELRERRSELRNMERRVESREENVEGRAKNLDKREKRNVEREKEIEIIAAEVETLQDSKVQELEKIAGLTVDEAKDRALDRLGIAEDDMQFEIIDEGSSSLFRLKRKEARLRARVKPVSTRSKTPDRRSRNNKKSKNNKYDKSGSVRNKNNNNSKFEILSSEIIQCFSPQQIKEGGFFVMVGRKK